MGHLQKKDNFQLAHLPKIYTLCLRLNSSSLTNYAEHKNKLA